MNRLTRSISDYASPPAPIWAGGECECSCPCMGSSSDEWDNFSAIDDDFEQEFENVNSGEIPTDKRDEQLFAKDSVKSDAISTTEDYYSSSIDDTVQSGESTNETSTYEPEVSTDAWSCSGSTPLPPEPTILILEGEAPFSLFLCFNLFLPESLLLFSFKTFTFYFSSSLMLMLTSLPVILFWSHASLCWFACTVVVIVICFVVVGSVICVDYNGSNVILSHYYEFHN